MADHDMADDDKANKDLALKDLAVKDLAVKDLAATSEGQTPADPPKVEPSAQTFQQATTPEPRESGDKSEWTVSDARGPLHRAEEGESAGTHPETVPAATTSDNWTASDARSEHPASAFEPTAEAPHPAHAAADPVEPKSNGSLPNEPVPPYLPEERRSLLPIAAALLIGALVGAGSAAIVYRTMQGDSGSDLTAQLGARVDALEKRPDPQASSASLQASFASLKGNVADLDGKVAALGQGGGKSGGDAIQAAADLVPLQQKVAALQASLDALKSADAGSQDLAPKIAALEGAVAGMKTQAASAQAGVTAVQGEQKDLAGKVMVPALAVVADSLVQQIGHGETYAAQVDALAALGADPVKIAVLRQNADKGVPSAKLLAAKFEPLAEPIVATAHKAPADAGFVDRLKSGMLSMVSVRRTDDTSGSDPASRVARIKADLAHDDVADALATWEALPADAKAKGEAWAALAKTQAEAMSAARALQHEAIAALGAKKS